MRRGGPITYDCWMESDADGVYHFQQTKALCVPISRTMISLAGRISRHFHLRVQTQAFNAHHDTFSLRLASRDYLRTRKFLLLFYDTGSVLGVFGMLTAIVLLVWTTVSLSSSAFLRLTAPDTSTSLLKRAVEVSSGAQTYSSGMHAVNPIVSSMQCIRSCMRSLHRFSYHLECLYCV